MINDFFVIDAVVHAFNFDPSNASSKYGLLVAEAVAQSHRQHYGGLEHSLSEEEYRQDWPMEVLARTVFLESDVDIAVTHTLRLDSWFKDGMCSRAKTVEAVRRWPDRFIGYVAVDPFAGLDVCLRELDEQLEELPEAVGIKLYPARVNPHARFRLDDTEVGLPLIARCAERGLKTIAMHKAVLNGRGPLEPFRVDDMALAADAFPEINFEIVHAGMAFLEETAMLMASFPNVYAQLEATSALAWHSPGMFEQIMATFVHWGGTKKIIFADGAALYATQSLLEKFATFSFSEQTMEAFGIPQITDEDRALILGGNYARMIGLDIEAAKARLANDEFAQEKAETGRQAPYSNMKTALAVHA
jgi:predicted TIM-barrel fold metal-dependent hydrolase